MIFHYEYGVLTEDKHAKSFIEQIVQMRAVKNDSGTIPVQQGIVELPCEKENMILFIRESK